MVKGRNYSKIPEIAFRTGLFFMLVAGVVIAGGNASAWYNGIDSTRAGREEGRDTLAAPSADNLVSPGQELGVSELKNILTDQTGGIPETRRNWHNSKNARVAMLCTLLFPGLGQMYNERPVKAVIACGLEVFYLHQILRNRRLAIRERKVRDSYDKSAQPYRWSEHDWWYNEYRERSIDWVWWSSGLMVALLIDSYVDAKLHDMNFSIEKYSSGGGGGISLSFDF